MSAEMTFAVLPDGAAAGPAARLLTALPGARVVPHASGRPWLVGRWPHGALRVAGTRRARLAVAGFTPVTADFLAGCAAAVSDVRDLDGVARRLGGSAHLIASAGGRVRVQGTASGVRAVFHCRLAGATVAADRADALAGPAGACVDETALALRLLTPAVPAPLDGRPVWRGVERLAPEDWLLMEPDGTHREHRWWSPPPPTLTVRQGAPAVREALDGAVRGRVAGHGVVSADLSGGLDSGTVAHLAARAGARLITVRTPQIDPAGDDAAWAGRTARRLPDAEHLLLGYEDAPTMFAGLADGSGADGAGRGGARADRGSVLATPEEPPFWARAGARFADVGRRVAARGSRLHLCGHGGDELFLLPAAHLHTLVRTRPLAAARQVRGRAALHHWPPGATWRALAESRTFAAWLAHCAARLTAPAPHPRAPQFGWTPALRMPPWATGDAVAAVRGLLAGTARQHPEPLAPGRGPHAVLESVRRAGAMVRCAERLMASHGVPFAAPYLDDRVVEAALAVRPGERGTPHRYKPLLAEAMRGLVPDDLRGRGTKGDYGEDAFDGLRRHRAGLLDLFDGSELARRGLVDDAAVRSALTTVHTTAAPLIALEPTLACEVWLRSLPSAATPTRPAATEAAP